MPDQTPSPETRTRARAVLDALLPGVRDRAVDALGPVEGEGLAARLEHHHLDLLAPLDRLYVTDDVTLAALAGRLVDRVVTAAIDRPVALRALDRRREVDPGWFQRARMVG
jgi:amylosucrase